MRTPRRFATPEDVASGTIQRIEDRLFKAVFMPVKCGPGPDDYETRAVWHRAYGKEIRRHERTGSWHSAQPCA